MLKRYIPLIMCSFLAINTIPSLSIFNPAESINCTSVDKALLQDTADAKRGNPTYDYVIGSDHWPHFRVFFWVDKNAKNYIPYADAGVKTDVSEHGSVEKWNVVETNTIKDNEKLVFIYVPKTFVFIQGKGFEDKIHLRYDKKS